MTNNMDTIIFSSPLRRAYCAQSQSQVRSNPSIEELTKACKEMPDGRHKNSSVKLQRKGY